MTPMSVFAKIDGGKGLGLEGLPPELNEDLNTKYFFCDGNKNFTETTGCVYDEALEEIYKDKGEKYKKGKQKGRWKVPKHANNPYLLGISSFMAYVAANSETYNTGEQFFEDTVNWIDQNLEDIIIDVGQNPNQAGALWLQGLEAVTKDFDEHFKPFWLNAPPIRNFEGSESSLRVEFMHYEQQFINYVTNQINEGNIFHTNATKQLFENIRYVYIPEVIYSHHDWVPDYVDAQRFYFAPVITATMKDTDEQVYITINPPDTGHFPMLRNGGDIEYGNLYEKRILGMTDLGPAYETYIIFSDFDAAIQHSQDVTNNQSLSTQTTMFDWYMHSDLSLLPYNMHYTPIKIEDFEQVETPEMLPNFDDLEIPNKRPGMYPTEIGVVEVDDEDHWAFTYPNPGYVPGQTPEDNTYLYPMGNPTGAPVGQYQPNPNTTPQTQPDGPFKPPTETPTAPPNNNFEPGKTCNIKNNWDDWLTHVDQLSNKFPFSLPFDAYDALDAVFGTIKQTDDPPDIALPEFLGKDKVLEIPDFVHELIRWFRMILIVLFDLGLIYAFSKWTGGAE